MFHEEKKIITEIENIPGSGEAHGDVKTLWGFFFPPFQVKLYRIVPKMVTFLTIFAHCFELPSLVFTGTEAQKGQEM